MVLIISYPVSLCINRCLLRKTKALVYSGQEVGRMIAVGCHA